MRGGSRWLAEFVALSSIGLGCFRTPMDLRHGVTKNDTSEGGATGTSGGARGGTVSTAGTTGVADPGPPSCVGLAATCGPSNESCCASPAVAGGTFNRDRGGGSPDTGAPPTVSDFYLQRWGNGDGAGG